MNDVINLSKNSTNPYLVETRHNLIAPCFICGEFKPVLLDGNDYYSYFVMGKFVQNCFPYLSPSEREFIRTGIHVDCQAKLWEDEEK